MCSAPLRGAARHCAARLCAACAGRRRLRPGTPRAGCAAALSGYNIFQMRFYRHVYRAYRREKAASLKFDFPAIFACATLLLTRVVFTAHCCRAPPEPPRHVNRRVRGAERLWLK